MLIFESSNIDMIVKIWGAVSGSIGVVLGIYNLLYTKRKENKEKLDEENDWNLLVELRASLGEKSANLFQPKFGSEEHKWAERMVSKGYLHRLEIGLDHAYTLVPFNR
jgi:hypothetical protein